MGSIDQTVFVTGPEPTLKLAYSDVWFPGLYSRRVLCFQLPEGSSHEKVINVVTRALKALVLGTPELGATSVVISNAAEHDKTQPWRALAPGDGIHLVIKDYRDSFPSYQALKAAGFPLEAFKDRALMPIAASIMPEPQPQTKFQLSVIDGGVLLSVCIYHHLTDGNGMNTITRALAEECQKASVTEGNLPPRVLQTDRSIMNSLNGGNTNLDDHPAHGYTLGAYRPDAHHDEAPPEDNGEAAKPPPQFRPAYFFLTHEKAQALKDYGSRDMPVSTHDAITALLWRNLVATRLRQGELAEDVVSTFTVPHDSRKHIGLDSEWLGNCVYFVVAEATVSDIVKDGSLPTLAAKIRTAINKVNREMVEGVMTIRRRDPYSLTWWPVSVMHEPQIVGITSMYHSQILGTNWGPALGDVEHFTATDTGAFGSDFQRSHYVGPKIPGGRGCHVGVGLWKQEVDTFATDPLWSEYFKLLYVRDGEAEHA